MGVIYLLAIRCMERSYSSQTQPVHTFRSIRKLPDEESLDPTNKAVSWPLTDEQRNDLVKNFTQSIDPEAICALASKANNNKPCSITGLLSGSFNLCYIIDFDAENTKWVFRIPIEPVVYNAWGKLQSEVITMQYIQAHTNVSLPRIHSYGRDPTLSTSGSTIPYLVLDYIPGRTLTIERLVESTREQQSEFFAELIDIFVQLRKLEFPKVGSLMPNPKGGYEPIIGAPFSIALNELETIYRRKQNVSCPFDSAKEFVEYLYTIVSETYQVPLQDRYCPDVDVELFILSMLAEQMPDFINGYDTHGPFILRHNDLRCGNIIIDDDLHIQTIIDWEWANTVPRHLFTPPAWITGHDPDYPEEQSGIFSLFCEVLEAKGKTSHHYDRLIRDWNFLRRQTQLHMAQILHHLLYLVHAYCEFMYSNQLEKYITKAATKFCAESEELMQKAAEQMIISDHYTRYLRDAGLYEEDKETEQQREKLNNLLQAQLK